MSYHDPRILLRNSTALPRVGHKWASDYPGLYDGRVHGDCAVFSAIDLKGESSRELLEQALNAAVKMCHRGGLLPDQVDSAGTSHGVGFLINGIGRWLAKTGDKQFGEACPEGQFYAVAPMFWRKELQDRDVRGTVEEVLLEEFGDNAAFIWRRPKVNQNAVGKLGWESFPNFAQLWVRVPQNMAGQGKMVVLRKKIERSLEKKEMGSDLVSILSLSCNSVVYKGLTTPANIADFYPDLKDSDLKAKAVIGHVRQATNSSPDWFRAQPIGMMAHNGEVNTDVSCTEDMLGIVAEWRQDGDFRGLPLVDLHQTDSGRMRLRIEAAVYQEEKGLEYALALNLQSQGRRGMSEDERAMRQSFFARVVGSEGPIALHSYANGVLGVAADAAGLRPIRYCRVGKRLYAASEAGGWPFRLGKKHRQLRGGDILIGDSNTGKVRVGEKVIEHLCKNHDFRASVEPLEEPLAEVDANSGDLHELTAQAAAYGIDYQGLNYLMVDMAQTGHEAVRAMGNQLPLPSFSEVGRGFTAFWASRFAQITNPPLDAYREKDLFSLRTFLGKRGEAFGLKPVKGIFYKSPVLSDAQLAGLLEDEALRSRMAELSAVHTANEGFKDVIERLKVATKTAVETDCESIFINCDGAGKESPKGGLKQAFPAALAVRVVRETLLDLGALRNVSIILKSSEMRTSAHLALALSAGADLVHPGIVYQLAGAIAKDEGWDGGASQAAANVKVAFEDGLLKFICRLGILTVQGYRGGMFHDPIGLDQEVCTLFGKVSAVGGAGFSQLEKNYRRFAEASLQVRQGDRFDQGVFKHSPETGERTRMPREVLVALQKAAYLYDKELPEDLEPSVERFRELEDKATALGPFALRDLLDLAPQSGEAGTVTWQDVASVLNGGSMSLGALSEGAHMAIAMGLNYVGSMSSSGEGGMHPLRYQKPKRGLPALNCRRVQIASGHFGVWLNYLAQADEVEVKFGQAAKPGLGGQLSATKVTSVIASIRGVKDGQELISPPPQHLMYSIEDVLSLVHALKEVNPECRVILKVVAQEGIGAIACGAATCNADEVLICGAEGGTGASPYTFIQYTVSPIEAALVEAHEALCDSGLRHKVRLSVDGALGMSARDIVKLMALGAQGFGLGTALMVAVGCVKADVCNKICPANVATGTGQELVDRWRNVALFVRGLCEAVAEEINSLRLGGGMEKVVGRSDLLSQNEELCSKFEGSKFDFSRLLHRSDAMKVLAGNLDHTVRNDFGFHRAKSKALLEAEDLFGVNANGSGEVWLQTPLGIADRAFGVAQFGDFARSGETPNRVVHTSGWAGQYYGYLMPEGFKFVHTGGSSDYLGASLSGGTIVVKSEAGDESDAWVIDGVGNLVMHAATGGQIFVGSRVCNRAALRLSNGDLFCLGAGDFLGEYMTGGRILALGTVGKNVGAGMSGGAIYLPVTEADKANEKSTRAADLDDEAWEELQSLIQAYRKEVGDKVVDSALKEIGGFKRENFCKLETIVSLADVSGAKKLDYTPFLDEKTELA